MSDMGGKREVRVIVRATRSLRNRLEAQAEKMPRTWGARPNTSDATRKAMRNGLTMLETADRLRGDD